MTRIAIIGCGAMGTAFAKAWANKKNELILCDHSREKAESLARSVGGKSAHDPKKAIKGAELILLAIKPGDLAKFSRTVGRLGREQILLSILAGISVQQLQEALPGGEIVRLMPNLAVREGKSVLALAKESTLSAKGKKRLEGALKGLGKILWVEEKKLAAVTALAGSGPAYILAFIEAFVEGGILLGLSSQEALALTLQAIEGTVSLLEKDPFPQQLRWQITSPAGTTIHGLKVLEEGAMRAVVIEALRAAYLRSLELRN